MAWYRGLRLLAVEKVFSFDHIAINNKVTPCDIESGPLSDEASDNVVFSLSLMGRDCRLSKGG